MPSNMNKEQIEPCPEPPEPFVKITEDGFGLATMSDGTKEIIRRYTFKNQNHLCIQVITYGATITSITYPDKHGYLDDIVLGFDDMEGYQSANNPYFGATIGRCSNRIAKGHFKIGKEEYQLSINSKPHHIHGGFKGFDKVNWKSYLFDKTVIMTYLSKDGEEGYPGELLASVSFEMTISNEFIINMKATCSKPTPVSMSNHTYFNLAGHSRGPNELYEHRIMINADRFCQTNEDLIPTGMLKNVVNTMWDLRVSRKMGKVLHHTPFGGYDQNFCIHKTTSEDMTFIARAAHPPSGRVLEIYSNQPGLQFYTANHFPQRTLTASEKDESEMLSTDDNCIARKCPCCGQIIRDFDFENPSDEDIDSNEEVDEQQPHKVKLLGKGGAKYYKFCSFILMPQQYPDAIHRKNFPSNILYPGDTYSHLLKWKFMLLEEVDIQADQEEDGIIDDSEMEMYEEEGEEKEKDLKEEEHDDLLGTKLEENGR